MAFTGNTICDSYRRELMEAAHDHRTHVFKLALYTSAATLNAATTDYTTAGEVSGTGYTAGGYTLTSVVPALSGSGKVAFAGFSDLIIEFATFVTRGALIYNTTAWGGTGTTNAVMVLDFGLDRTSSAIGPDYRDFVIRMPTADAINAILRIQ